jgi:lipopolysaccharide/colanic/teichoic acid biosynthesis glycosyltransferase
MYKSFFKRLIDILVALVALPFVLLVIVIFGPIIFLTDRGPVFYNAPRVGKNGKVFNMYKLRSMKVNAPDIRNADGSTYNAADDPRVTKIGRLMRKTSVDELPQFLNVLFGHMSLIGPRPSTPKILDEMTPLKAERLKVRPGITGYTQMKYRNSAQGDARYQADKYYVENLSFSLDVAILFGTVLKVLKRENIYNSGAPMEKEAEEVGGHK